jgi:hypothetical protein
MIEQVPIQVANAAALITLGYTKIEVWSSEDSGATFQEITSPSAAPAVLTSSPANTMFRMAGTQLELSIGGGATQTFSFSSMLTYWTPTQVVNQINMTLTGAVASVVGNSVVITSTATGRVASISVVYNDATDLGFTSGQQVNGTDARLTLVGTTYLYVYSDVAGDSDALYQWRFSANGVNPISDFSTPPISGTPPPVGPIAWATATFIDATGQPAQRTVIIASAASPTEVGSPPLVVGSETPLTFTADVNGFLAIPLAVGQTVRAAIDGTALVREFVVPGPANSQFDLLQAIATAPDPFTVQVPPPFLTRRSL